MLEIQGKMVIDKLEVFSFYSLKIEIRQKPEERPDIFEIVEFLRIVVEKVEAEDAENG